MAIYFLLCDAKWRINNKNLYVSTAGVLIHTYVVKLVVANLSKFPKLSRELKR